MEATKGVEDFLGVCLGGKKCKERKKLRQDNRKDKKENRIERRSILTEKKRAKKDGLMLENEANKSTNELLKQLTQPQEQAQSRQIQVEQQKALPPIPQNNPPKQDNTLLWVGGGFGTLIILGLIVFLLVK